MAHLTTHVLDTSRGLPAQGVAVEVHRVVGGTREILSTATTGPDGRTPAPLLEGATLTPGYYELIFKVGGYFVGAGMELTSPPFLDEITIRIGIADPAGRYHVPLLVSPYGYSTYRGS